MTRAVAIIGTSHKYQWPGNPAADAFQKFIIKACMKLKAKALAEEASLEALSQKHTDQSLCKIIADDLNIAHRYCDPSNEQRLSLNINGMQAIQLDGFFSNSNPGYTERRIIESHRSRECFWLQELMKLDNWPALFVCGATHVESFRAMLEATGFHVDVVVRDWQPTNASSC